MRRWNGWGNDSVTYPLPETAAEYLIDILGPGYSSADADYQSVLSRLPPSRLAAHPLTLENPDVRLRHARGQSLPDWIALRSGNLGIVPDGVATTESVEQVRTLMQHARKHRVQLVPYRGGTSPRSRPRHQ